MRSHVNAALVPLANLIPRRHRGVKIEYDITYEGPGGQQIAGYKMTDLLTKCLWLAPCDTVEATRQLSLAIQLGATMEGRAIALQLAREVEDKYLLRSMWTQAERIVVMPGSNLLQRNAVDWKKVDHAVGEGAMVKAHPITNPIDLHRLRQRYNNRLLPVGTKLYSILRAAKVIHGCANSESRLLAALWQKPWRPIQSDTAGPLTFSAFDTVLSATSFPYEALVALLSQSSSGLISIYHADPEKRIAEYFAQYADYEHVGSP